MHEALTHVCLCAYSVQAEGLCWESSLIILLPNPLRQSLPIKPNLTNMTNFYSRDPHLHLLRLK